MVRGISSCVSVRFRRFANKAYSVFCSLGKVISIGQLSADVSDCSVKTLHKKLQAGFVKEQHFTEKEFDFEQFTQGLNTLNLYCAAVLAANNKNENHKTSGFYSFNRSPLPLAAEGFCIINTNKIFCRGLPAHFCHCDGAVQARNNRD